MLIAFRPVWVATLSVFALLIFSCPGAGAQSFVQVNSAVPTSGSQVPVVYTKAQTAGNLNVVVVGWSDSTSTVTSVSDTQGNVYSLAVGPMVTPGVSQSIYYAKNIVGAGAGVNTVTVKFNATASYPDIRIAEYSGLDLNNPLDVSGGTVGTATSVDSGAVSTTNANDLLVGADTVLTLTTAAGAGYSNRIITYPDGDLLEDRVVSATGSYHATATLSGGGGWVMQLVAFKAAGAAPAPSAPSNVVATVISSSQINVGWTASTEVGGTISSYLVERCQGAGCVSFAQVGTSTGTNFSDTGLANGTSYSYRVRAKDTANNIGPYSNVASATTTVSGVPTPTAPGNLTAVAGAPGPMVVVAQGYINTTSLLSHTTAAFDSTGGDLIVLCASSHQGVTMTPADSYNNAWISIAGPTSTTVGDDLRTQVWYARIPTVGAGHTVTVNLSIAQPLVIAVIVVKGSNVGTPIDAVSAIGTDNGTQSLSVASPNITTTTASDLLIGFAKSSFGAIWSSGPGFTQQPAASSNFLDTETGLAASPGVYAATFGVGGNVTWEAVVVAASPSLAAANPNQVNLAWTAATETGGTVSSYLIERCQGVGCSSFAQIGTTASTNYNDTNVTPSTSYTYRVRAVDTVNTVGPYSNLVTAATK
jgi:chitodextrinase